MVVYVDLVFVLNFLVNLIFLYVIEKIFKDEIKKNRMILSSLLFAFISMLCIFNKFFYITFKIIGGILIVMIGLKKTVLSKQIIKISLFYMENLAFTGFLSAYKINSLFMLFVSMTVILGLLFFEHFKNYYILLANYKYNIIVIQKGKKIYLDAVLDTGNNACSERGIPIVFIKNKYFNETFDNYELVSIETINGKSLNKAYEVDEFYIEFKGEFVRKEVLIVFTNLEEGCLLNSILLI